MLAVIFAYLIGSIPFGYLIVRATGGGDVREIGSGGTGATNVSRRAGRAAGVMTLILDALKGVLAVIIAKSIWNLDNTDWLIAAAAVAAMVGHIFPIWLRFRGGKGVATGAGVFLALSPMAVLFAGLVFVAMVWWRKTVSLGSLAGAVTIPVYVYFTPHTTPLLVASVAGAWLIVFAHRGNVARIWNGTEPRISDLRR
ncbi:MAG TPA: glycerol-3-phosphate 1-O-acyltransferase PlsY [Pyrinomonadaceae bacterium]|nr:glycerol-3-phosphate 1-O-acyltransferase PlsY [Pyrinomonadaceae bacterium]